MPQLFKGFTVTFYFITMQQHYLSERLPLHLAILIRHTHSFNPLLVTNDMYGCHLTFEGTSQGISITKAGYHFVEPSMLSLHGAFVKWKVLLQLLAKQQICGSPSPP